VKVTVKLTVTVEVQHVSGKFVRREEIAEQLRDSLECDVPDLAQDADLSGLGEDGESEYQVESVEVEGEVAP
jgi:hypothetical protein